MRDIKFRGYSKKEKCWFYGWLEGIMSISGTKYSISQESDWGLNINFRVDKESIGQYTGIQDKNGKEIYTGDILKVTPRTKRERIGYVEYSEKYGQYLIMVKSFYYDGDDKVDCYKELCHSGSSTHGKPYNFHSYGAQKEVIGNIYESPELLT